VVEFLDFVRSNIGPHVTMEQVRVPTKTQSVHQLSELLNSQVVVLAIRKEGGETIFNPPQESKVSAGDFLIVVGERSGLQKLEKNLNS
jgi:voltage-gated potassium channel